jgi:hypothetical protein
VKNNYKQCYFSKKIGSGTNRVAQNSFGEGEVLVILMPGKRGSGTPFQLASF